MNPKKTMRGVIALLVAGFCLFSAESLLAQSTDASSRVYELRTYTTLPGRLPALNKRFADHTIRLFARHGIKSERYWIPTDDARKDNTLIYILSHDSQEAADKNWKEFQADPEWVQAREASESDGKILAKPPERIFMKMTDYSPGK
jgi:NIPSNAP